MNILVTGGAGFIGSHIVDAYLGLGHHVVIVDNLSSGRKQNINKKADFYQMDIQDKGIRELFEKYRFKVVNHQAAQMDVRKSVQDPIYDAQNNVIGLLNVLQNCVAFSIRKVVFASSGGAVYGEQDCFPADEQHNTQPLSPYGITKLIGEKYLYFYKQNGGPDYVALRYANVFGPRQNPHGEAGVVAIFSKMLLSGDQPVINGTGEQTRDFVYVKDVVQANVLALEYPSSDIFNVGTGIETNVNQIYRAINQLTGANKPEKHGPGKEGEQFRSVISHVKIKKAGWEPAYSVERGLTETVEYFLQHENA
ncbi:NAD-dependent epimerase/dehydratase family protein [candidate division KSB1 bacterium]|nr:NAD-dependent epimerase/dehydratase family protein [candidate division KSB1 bacterium]